jgi:hypothetical protein
MKPREAYECFAATRNRAFGICDVEIAVRKWLNMKADLSNPAGVLSDDMSTAAEFSKYR